jgi:hypothetical protein
MPRTMRSLWEPRMGLVATFWIDELSWLMTSRSTGRPRTGCRASGRVAKVVKIGGAGPEARWSGSDGEVEVGG